MPPLYGLLDNFETLLTLLEFSKFSILKKSQLHAIFVIKVLSERLSEIQSNQLSTESHYYTQILGLQEMNDSLLKVSNVIPDYSCRDDHLT